MLINERRHITCSIHTYQLATGRRNVKNYYQRPSSGRTQQINATTNSKINTQPFPNLEISHIASHGTKRNWRYYSWKRNPFNKPSMNKNFNDGIIFKVDNKFLQTPTKTDNIIHAFSFQCFSKWKKSCIVNKKLIVIKLQILILE